MIDQRERFERAFELFEMPEPAFERLGRRRDLKRRKQRITAAAVALGLVAIGIGAWVGAVRIDRSIPADRNVSPTPALATRVHSPSFRPALTYTAPRGSGWSVAYDDWVGDVHIGEDIDVGRREQMPRIWVTRDPEAASYDCPAQAFSPVPKTAEELTRWFVGHPSVHTSDPQAVTIGGLEGTQFDTAASREAPLCRGVPLLAFPGWGYPFHGWSLFPGSSARVYVLQLPRQEAIVVVVITIRAFDSSELLAEATRIVESFRFDLSEGDL